MKAARNIGDLRFCCFDVETTGLSSFSRLVEIGAVRFRIGEKGEEFSTLVNPGQPIPLEATLIHGISDDMVRDAPRAKEALERFLAFAEDCVLVAHNAAFDARIMALEAVRVGLSLPEVTVLDSISMARSFLPWQESYRLDTLAGSLGLDTRSLHRALPDARAVRAVVEASVTSIPGWKKMLTDRLFERVSGTELSSSKARRVTLPPGFGELKKAVEAGKPVRIIYAGGTRGRIPRDITPIAVYTRRECFYLEAVCHLDGTNKTFRLDRIVKIEMDESP
ncbi:MAG: WYL domain-containing protein [Actinobacteria bacterium]|nr:WYL domain-containing protein [Actinomycetota bacterium]